MIFQLAFPLHHFIIAMHVFFTPRLMMILFSSFLCETSKFNSHFVIKQKIRSNLHHKAGGSFTCKYFCYFDELFLQECTTNTIAISPQL